MGVLRMHKDNVDRLCKELSKILDQQEELINRLEALSDDMAQSSDELFKHITEYEQLCSDSDE